MTYEYVLALHPHCSFELARVPLRNENCFEYSFVKFKQGSNLAEKLGFIKVETADFNLKRKWIYEVEIYEPYRRKGFGLMLYKLLFKSYPDWQFRGDSPIRQNEMSKGLWAKLKKDPDLAKQEEDGILYVKWNVCRELTEKFDGYENEKKFVYDYTIE